MGQAQEPWYRKERSCWYVWHRGKQHKLHPNKVEAYRLWHELVNSPASGITICEGAQKYMVYARENVKVSTAVTYERILKMLPQDQPMETFDFKGWVNKNRRWSRSYIATVVRQTKMFYRWAEKNGLIASNPAQGVSEPGIVSRGNVTIQKDEHAQLVALAPPCYQDTLNFLWHTGCRPAEMVRITAGHYTSGVILLPDHKTVAKTGKPRLIVLNEEATQIIERLIKIRPEGPLFRTTHGAPQRPRSILRWLYNRSRGRGGIRKMPYSYRHSYATQALVNGIPDAVVAQLMGHSDTRMIHQHYAHLSDQTQYLKNAANKVRD